MRAAVALLLTLAACGPMTAEQVERLCAERAWQAERPRGTAELGIGSGGRVHSGLQLTVTSDYLMGRDPSAVYDACVTQKTGQPPARPLYSR